MIEYEIKISRSDYKADFKKEGKHERLLSGKGPNRFFFVVPDGLIGEEECPDYAGLIYIDYSNYELGSCCIMKSAPLLHKKKAFEIHPNIYKELAQSLAFRERITKQKLNECRRIMKANNVKY